MLFLLAGLLSPAHAASVLIIWDDSATNANTVSLKNYLQAQGHNVTLSSDSETAYTGSNPAPTGFGAVIHLNGTTYGTPMPTAGQTALVSYVQNGGGFISGEWNAYEQDIGVTAMRELVLLDRVSGSSTSTTITVSNTAHAVMAGLGNSFALPTAGINVGGAHSFSSYPVTVLATDNAGSAAVAVREYMNGKIVSFHNSGNWNSSSILSDSNMQRLYANAVSWVTSTACVDSDRDGYTATSCGGTDCNDSNAAISPGDPELCNGTDDDCDGSIDESSATNASTWYQDSDADSYGNSGVSAVACSAPSGYVANSTDCNDSNNRIYPGASEYCNSVDDDCDGTTDESSAVDASTWYQDSDADTYGNPSVASVACTAPSGYVSRALDCNDSSAAISPAASERCNSVDDDCDGSVDEASAVDASTWYQDSDGDSYGNSSNSQRACSAPSGYVAVAQDCNDSDADINPAELEYCNGTDDNCDGSTDDSSAVDQSYWYPDADADSYGSSSGVVVACDLPRGYVSNSADCDDTNTNVNPGRTERCNGVDDDCDGLTDDPSASDATTWYVDGDGDGYGNASAATVACNSPSGHVADGDDCDDGDAAISPAGTERCNGTDDDCDNATDENSAVDATTWYLDRDGDGYGDATSPSPACSMPTGYATLSTDCQDLDAAISPAGTEVCNGTDDNCDGLTDDTSAADAATWYVDADGDGYGDDRTANRSCDGTGRIATGGDCNDADAAISPATSEVAYDGIDQDCSGSDLCDADADRYDDVACGGDDCDDEDATINISVAETWYDGVDSNCDGASDYDRDGDGWDSSAWGGLDCDDSDPASHPGATEIWYDRVDQDCAGDSDYDADGDGFDSQTYGGTDCDDDRDDVYPGATDIPYDGIYQDCDAAGEYDADSDGQDAIAYGGTDCDDNNSAILVGGEETAADGLDGDCDGSEICFVDADADGQRPDADSTLRSDDLDCADAGEADGAAATTDCDDNNAVIYLDAEELCDELDNNCDTEVDEGCDVGPTDDSGTKDTGSGKGDPTCGCSTGAGSGLGLVGLLGLGAVLRRRRA
jgi:MYXO-CTERM domain-containing protein